MTFINDDFLLQGKTARGLYHDYAARQPVMDYHNHLPPADIASDRQFANLYEIWLGGDHYKWRAMRANGVAEQFCTGDADPRDKFLAWARTVPNTLRNPLYHWTHLELARFFGIKKLLNDRTASEVWDRANELLQAGGLSARGILKKFDVRALCTTDDPADDLAAHKQIAESDMACKVYPAFRPDKALAVDQPELFNGWLDRLSGAADVDINTLSGFLDALDKRHQYFHEIGCRLSDHGLATAFADFPDETTARSIFDKARAGRAATPTEQAQFASHLMLFFGHLDAKRGWTKQVHLGALRSVNSRALERLGPDTGFDSIGDYQQARALGA